MFLVCFVLREIGFYVVFNLIVLGTSWAIDVVDFWFGHATSVVFYCLLVFAVPVCGCLWFWIVVYGVVLWQMVVCSLLCVACL